MKIHLNPVSAAALQRAKDLPDALNAPVTEALGGNLEADVVGMDRIWLENFLAAEHPANFEDVLGYPTEQVGWPDLSGDVLAALLTSGLFLSDQGNLMRVQALGVVAAMTDHGIFTHLENWQRAALLGAIRRASELAVSDLNPAWWRQQVAHYLTITDPTGLVRPPLED